MGDDVIVQLENVTIGYGDKILSAGIDLTLRKGEKICICGKSGSGKTTLLRVILGLEKQLAGNVRVNTDKISAVFQEDRLLEHLTALGNLKAVGIDKEKGEKYLEKVGLSADIKKRPYGLSGGMKRRLALARALAFGGELYIMDEPLTGLDGETEREMLLLIKKETENAGLIMVTHNERAAEIIGARKYEI